MTSEKKRSSLRIILSTLGLLIGFCLVPGWLLRKAYMYEYDAVRDRLEDVPGIRILDMWGNEDVHLEDIWAEFQVGEKGLLLIYMDEASFTGTNYLPLYRVGAWDLDVCSEDERPPNLTDGVRGIPEWNWSNSINVAPGGRFSGLFPFELRTVQDVVRHYDEIERIVAAMPRDPAPRQLRILPDGSRVLLGTNDPKDFWPLRTTRCVEPSPSP